VALPAFAASAQVKITPGPQKIAVEINGKPFTDFYIAGDQVVKPYLFPLRAATGTYVTRMWPLEKVAEEDKMFEAKTIKTDHPHQRGLWFAHDSVNKLDFWNIAPLDQAPYNRPDRGKIVLDKVGKVTSGKKKGSIAATFDWENQAGDTLLKESRVTTFYADPAERVVDFDITLTAVPKVVFGDSKDGFFGIRLRPVLQEDIGTGHITNADGLKGEKELWGKPSNWCDYSGTIGDEKVGLTILDNPGNPRHPVRWHARAYGLFAANPFGVSVFTGDRTKSFPMDLEPGKSLRFRYRLIIHPGDAAAANIPAQWEKYIKGK
jgi:Family of unknown function (DUF6807)